MKQCAYPKKFTCTLPWLHLAGDSIIKDICWTSELASLLDSSEGQEWDNANMREVDRLAHGFKSDIPAGINAIFFIDHNIKLEHKNDIYVHIITTERPPKKETKRFRKTVRGYRIQCNGDLATPTANLTTVKWALLLDYSIEKRVCGWVWSSSASHSHTDIHQVCCQNCKWQCQVKALQCSRYEDLLDKKPYQTG